jgi:aldose 1-epimerase
MEHDLHPQPGYPFSVRFAVEYSLSERGLAVRMTATNQGRDICPIGWGTHPYATLGTAVDDLVLSAPARTVLSANERGLPTGALPVDGTDYDFRQPRLIGPTVLDHCFTDLERDGSGLAHVELRDPSADTGLRQRQTGLRQGHNSLTIWFDERYSHVMIFTGDPLPDVARRALAVEPMTCPPNAFHTGDGVLRLEPGDSATGAWGITPSG